MCALYALLSHFMTEYAFVIDGSPNMYILRQRTSIFLVPKWSPASQTIVWFTFNFSLLSKNTFTIAKGNKYTVQAHGPPMKDSRNPTRQLREQKRTKLHSKQKSKGRKKKKVPNRNASLNYHSPVTPEFIHTNSSLISVTFKISIWSIITLTRRNGRKSYVSWLLENHGHKHYPTFLANVEFYYK